MLTDKLLDEIEAGQGETLTRLARLIQPSRSGRPTSLSCLLRWVLSGVEGADGQRVYLEAARMSGKWISTPGALRRFVLAQNPTDPATAGPQRSTSARHRAAEK